MKMLFVLYAFVYVQSPGGDMDVFIFFKHTLFHFI